MPSPTSESDGRSGADGDGPPRAVVIAAIIVAVLAVVGVLTVAALSRTSSSVDPVAVVAIPAPDADGEACRTLLAALPDEMAEYRRAQLIEPAPAGAAGWRRPGESDAVILRCGLDRPVEFVTGTPLQMVDDVAWVRIADTGRTTWIAVDRPVYVALTLPDGSGPSPIQLISRAIAAAMPAVPPTPGPPG